MLASRRCADQQDAGWCGWIGVTLLCPVDTVASRKPICRHIVIRVGELRAGLAGYRRLARILVPVPGNGRDPVKFFSQFIECGIGELRKKSSAKLRFFELRIGSALARF